MQHVLSLSESELAALIAEHVRAHVATALAPSPWLTAAEAARYLACPLSRVRKLTSLGSLPSYRDGGRVLYHRDDLDAYVRSGGATTC